MANPIIGVTVNPPNSVAVVPMTVNNLQLDLAQAQTAIANALASFDAAMVTFAADCGGSVAYNGATHQFSGTPAASPAITQGQLASLLTAYNAALSLFLLISPFITGAQLTGPGVNGIIIQVDGITVPNISTLSGALIQALQFAQSSALLPP